MTSTAVLLVLASTATTCGDDDPPPAQLAEHCGTHAAVRLLELQPDQLWLDTELIGDRLYHLVTRSDAEGTLLYPYQGMQLWSTGLCGESPRRIADDTQLISLPDDERPWPGLLLGCQAGTAIVIVDPEGATPPQPILPGATCGGHWTDFGLVQVAVRDDDTFAYLQYPYPDDPRTGSVAPVVLVERLAPAQSIHVNEDIVHAIDDDAALLRIDLADGSTTVLQTEVRDYSFSADERYLLWQDLTITGYAERPLGALLLRDTASGATIGLGSTAGDFDHTANWPTDDILIRTLGITDRLYHLPDLDFIDFPIGGRIRLLFDDGRLVVINDYQGDWLSRVDPDGTTTPLFNRRGEVRWVTAEEAAIVLEVPADVDDPNIAEGRVWSVPVDGSPARVLADRASKRLFPRDTTRLLTSVDVDPDPRHAATLLVVDRDTRDEQILDDHVTRWRVVTLADVHLTLYSVHDGERTGIWQSRLPDAP